MARGSDSKSSKTEDGTEEISTEDGNSVEDVEKVSDDGANEKEESSEGNGSDDDENDDDESENEDTSLHPSLTSTRESLFRKASKNKYKDEKNALTKLIPGYTAPMRLDSSSLNKYRCDIKELGRRAEKSDASTKDFSLEAIAKKSGSSMKRTKDGFLPKSYTAAYSHFKKGTKKLPDESAGKGWFGMKPSVMTEDLKTDLAIIRNRTYLDPKRFYKSTDKHHSVVQVGTVIEGAAEFYSSRLTKKERRANLTEELMADQATHDYAKNKFKKMSREKAYQAELRKHRPKKRSKKFY